jgi:hypothetical protein
MRTDFSVFRERLADACRARDVKTAELSVSTGLAPRRLVAPHLSGAGALDLHRVCQIADVLDVSVDYLTGRSNVMDVMEMPDLEHKPGAKSARKRRVKQF